MKLQKAPNSTGENGGNLNGVMYNANMMKDEWKGKLNKEKSTLGRQIASQELRRRREILKGFKVKSLQRTS